jgi:subtilisin family serine protease
MSPPNLTPQFRFLAFTLRSRDDTPTAIVPAFDMKPSGVASLCLSLLISPALGGIVPIIPVGETSRSEAKDDIIPNRWIVVFKPCTAAHVLNGHMQASEDMGTNITHTYDIGDHFRGYVFEGSPKHVNAIIARDSGSPIFTLQGLNQSNIDFIEPDRYVAVPNDTMTILTTHQDNSTASVLNSTLFNNRNNSNNSNNSNNRNNSSLITEETKCWGLHRISHKSTRTSKEPLRYTYDSSAGAGTWAYILDTGIDTAHPEFQGRAHLGANFVPNEEGDGDNGGHGTHVAGIVGSRSYGVAKRTNLVSVKVLPSNGLGTVSAVLAGLQWAVNNATESGRIGKAVVNLSLSARRFGGPSYADATMRAAKAAVEAGLFLAVAAGNSFGPADQYSPAAEASVCTVAAMDMGNKLARFSNHGKAIDISAPGVAVLSTYAGGSTKKLDGTSMASPHIAGLGAYLLALEGPRGGEDLCARIQELGVRGQLEGAKDKKTRDLIAGNGS